MEWKTKAKDSVKKAKTQQRRQEILCLSAMTQLDVDVLWLGVIQKSGNEHDRRNDWLRHNPWARCQDKRWHV